MGIHQLHPGDAQPALEGLPLWDHALGEHSDRVNDIISPEPDILSCKCGASITIAYGVDLETSGVNCTNCGSFVEDENHSSIGQIPRNISDIEGQLQKHLGVLIYKGREKEVILDVEAVDSPESKIGRKNATIYFRVGKKIWKAIFRVGEYVGDSHVITFIGNKKDSRSKFSSVNPLSSQLSEIMLGPMQRHIDDLLLQKNIIRKKRKVLIEDINAMSVDSISRGDTNEIVVKLRSEKHLYEVHISYTIKLHRNFVSGEKRNRIVEKEIDFQGMTISGVELNGFQKEKIRAIVEDRIDMYLYETHK